MVGDFPAILRGNLAGIYLWGSLTYDAFDEACSDVDCVAVTKRDISDREFSELDDWFKHKAAQNRWVNRIDMRFVIDKEQLDKSSRCCGFYHYAGKLIRHGSDGNPIIWMNVCQCGITLWGKEAKLIATHVPDECLNDAPGLELDYLKNDLTSNAGDRSDRAFIHNAYAVLTACRILYTAHHRTLASKDTACRWAVETVAPDHPCGSREPAEEWRLDEFPVGTGRDALCGIRSGRGQRHPVGPSGSRENAESRA